MIPATTPPLRHFVTLYDADDGSPYWEPCACSIGADHDGSGHLMSDD